MDIENQNFFLDYKDRDVSNEDIFVKVVNEEVLFLFCVVNE